MKRDIIMPESNPSLHFLSGIGAIMIYILLLLLLLGGFHFYKERVRYGDVQPDSDFIEQISPQESIELTEILQEPASQTIQPQQQPLIEAPKIAEPTPTPQKPTQTKPKKAVNLADVFATIPSETSQDKKAKEEAQRQQELQLRRKELEAQQKEKAEQLARDAAAIKQSAQALQQTTQNLQQNVKQALTTKINLDKPKFVGNSQDKAKYDKWYAQIEQILMAEWKKSSRFYQATTSAKVRIRIDSKGKLSYLHMITQSPYTEYNSSVIAFLKNMEKRLFPIPPEGDIDTNLELENTLKH